MSQLERNYSSFKEICRSHGWDGYVMINTAFEIAEETDCTAAELDALKRDAELRMDPELPIFLYAMRQKLGSNGAYQGAAE